MSEGHWDSFFAFLRSGEQGTSQSPSDQLRSSVLSHLRVLLNTTQGSSVTAPNYGLVDFSDLMLEVPDSLRVIERELRKAIVDFEPRLTRVRVRSIPASDPDKLAFQVAAVLVEDLSPIRFATSLTADGSIEVSS